MTVKIVFSATERANVKTDGMRSNILMPQENSKSFIDIDMQNRKINVNHQLQRKRNMEYVIEDTKTTSGTREIPMSDEVYACFQRIISNRKKVKTEPMIDGKCGFLYLDKK